MTIKKGDKVKVLAGKDRGKTGSVLKVLPEDNRVIVEGLNVVSKRTRPRRQGQKGETVQVARPLHASNVQLICKNCGKATRVGYKGEGEKKNRVCVKCDSVN